jgi:DNA-binding beta-propeller fold protein YncE
MTTRTWGTVGVLLLLMAAWSCKPAPVGPPQAEAGPTAGPSIESPTGPANPEATPGRTDGEPAKTGPALRHGMRLPARLALGPGGTLYVTDPSAGAVFVLDAALRPLRELGGLERPLGIAVDGRGMLWVGCDGGDQVVVLTPDGTRARTQGPSGLRMPNALAFDGDGNLYVVDSQADLVAVFDADGQPLKEIGAPTREARPLSFPVDVEVREHGSQGGREVLVADQGNARVQVFDARSGALLRSIGGPADPRGGEWHGRFAKPQALSMDSKGRLHVLDVQLARVQVFDPDSGALLASYGSPDPGTARLRLPLDLALGPQDAPLVVDAERKLVLALEPARELSGDR